MVAMDSNGTAATPKPSGKLVDRKRIERQFANDAIDYLRPLIAEVAASGKVDLQLGTASPYDPYGKDIYLKYLNTAVYLTVPRKGILGRKGYRRKVARVIVHRNKDREVSGLSLQVREKASSRYSSLFYVDDTRRGVPEGANEGMREIFASKLMNAIGEGQLKL